MAPGSHGVEFASGVRGVTAMSDVVRVLRWYEKAPGDSLIGEVVMPGAGLRGVAWKSCCPGREAMRGHRGNAVFPDGEVGSTASCGRAARTTS